MSDKHPEAAAPPAAPAKPASPTKAKQPAQPEPPQPALPTDARRARAKRAHQQQVRLADKPPPALSPPPTVTAEISPAPAPAPDAAETAMVANLTMSKRNGVEYEVVMLPKGGSKRRRLGAKSWQYLCKHDKQKQQCKECRSEDGGKGRGRSVLRNHQSMRSLYARSHPLPNNHAAPHYDKGLPAWAHSVPVQRLRRIAHLPTRPAAASMQGKGMRGAAHLPAWSLEATVQVKPPRLCHPYPCFRTITSDHHDAATTAIYHAQQGLRRIRVLQGPWPPEETVQGVRRLTSRQI